MKINKCDRCGQIVEKLIIVSTSIPKKEDFQEKEEKEYSSPFNLFFGGSNSKTVSLELCDDCLQVLVRWLAHPENYLMKLQKQTDMKKA